jgi:hypothetical protein
VRASARWTIVAALTPLLAPIVSLAAFAGALGLRGDGARGAAFAIVLALLVGAEAIVGSVVVGRRGFWVERKRSARTR